jgi:hypothetical protein
LVHHWISRFARVGREKDQWRRRLFSRSIAERGYLEIFISAIPSRKEDVFLWLLDPKRLFLSCPFACIIRRESPLPLDISAFPSSTLRILFFVFVFSSELIYFIPGFSSFLLLLWDSVRSCFYGISLMPLLLDSQPKMILHGPPEGLD